MITGNELPYYKPGLLKTIVERSGTMPKKLIIKKYGKKTDDKPVLESTTEDRALSFYCAVLPAFRRLYGISAHLVSCDEPV